MHLLIYNHSTNDASQHAVISWMTDPPERDAKLARDALKLNKKGVQHLKVIVEIACTTSPHHLMAVRQAYCSLFDCSFEEDIASTIPQPLRKVKSKQTLKHYKTRNRIDIVRISVLYCKAYPFCFCYFGFPFGQCKMFHPFELASNL